MISINDFQKITHCIFCGDKLKPCFSDKTIECLNGLLRIGIGHYCMISNHLVSIYSDNYNFTCDLYGYQLEKSDNITFNHKDISSKMNIKSWDFEMMIDFFKNDSIL